MSPPYEVVIQRWVLNRQWDVIASALAKAGIGTVARD
jgi:hypothetical protein